MKKKKKNQNETTLKEDEIKTELENERKKKLKLNINQMKLRENKNKILFEKTEKNICRKEEILEEVKIIKKIVKINLKNIIEKIIEKNLINNFNDEIQNNYINKKEIDQENFEMPNIQIDPENRIYFPSEKIIIELIDYNFQNDEEIKEIEDETIENLNEELQEALNFIENKNKFKIFDENFEEFQKNEIESDILQEIELNLQEVGDTLEEEIDEFQGKINENIIREIQEIKHISFINKNELKEKRNLDKNQLDNFIEKSKKDFLETLNKKEINFDEKKELIREINLIKKNDSKEDLINYRNQINFENFEKKFDKKENYLKEKRKLDLEEILDNSIENFFPEILLNGKKKTGKIKLKDFKYSL